MAKAPIKIGNAQGFWGDDPTAAYRLVSGAPDLDVLTLDYCAEVSMSILARQKSKDPNLGYARDFLDCIRSLVPVWKSGRRFRLVTNAGGLNPRACAGAVAEILAAAGLRGMKLGVVSGDDVLAALKSTPDDSSFRHLDSGKPLTDVLDRVVTANAYVGAEEVAHLLKSGADIVIAGRLADPSMVVAPCMAHFGWASDAYDQLAGATVAGHLVECGTQMCGGISTDWLNLPGNENIGFPIVEIAEDGSCVATKPANTGGAVNRLTVTEQLLYELGDPARYLSPDCTASFLTVKLDDLGNDRVQVRGASGSPPPPAYKVSATYRAGFRAITSLTIIGRDAVKKARRSGDAVLEKLRQLGHVPQRHLIEVVGSGDASGILPRRDDLFECVLRIGVSDARRDVVDAFAKQVVPLVTAGAQGTTGYFSARPDVLEYFGYWPCLIGRDRVQLKSEMMET